METQKITTFGIYFQINQMKSIISSTNIQTEINTQNLPEFRTQKHNTHFVVLPNQSHKIFLLDTPSVCYKNSSKKNLPKIVIPIQLLYRESSNPNQTINLPKLIPMIFSTENLQNQKLEILNCYSIPLPEKQPKNSHLFGLKKIFQNFSRPIRCFYRKSPKIHIAHSVFWLQTNPMSKLT
jgi:hypothetical protein